MSKSFGSGVGAGNGTGLGGSLAAGPQATNDRISGSWADMVAKNPGLGNLAQFFGIQTAPTNTVVQNPATQPPAATIPTDMIKTPVASPLPSPGPAATVAGQGGAGVTPAMQAILQAMAPAGVNVGAMNLKPLFNRGA